MNDSRATGQDPGVGCFWPYKVLMPNVTLMTGVQWPSKIIVSCMLERLLADSGTVNNLIKQDASRRICEVWGKSGSGDFKPIGDLYHCQICAQSNRLRGGDNGPWHV